MMATMSFLNKKNNLYHLMLATVSEDGENSRRLESRYACRRLRSAWPNLSASAGPSFRKVDGIRDAKDPSKPPIGGIMSSTVDSTGALWMATYGGGVWRYDGKSITHFPVKDGYKAITLFTIHKDNQGVMWVGTHSGGAYKFNGKKFEKLRP